MVIKWGFSSCSHEKLTLPFYGNSGEHYVYGYFDGSVPFYIGKGKGNRMYAHLESVLKNTSHRESNQHKIRKIKKILTQGREPYIRKIYDKLSNEEALKIEMELIQFFCYPEDSDVLTNIVRDYARNGGGDTLTHHPNRQEICNRISKTIKEKCLSAGQNNPCYGLFGENHPAFQHKKTPQGLKNISDAAKRLLNFGEHNPMYGVKHTQESKDQISKTRKEKGSAKGKNNSQAKCYKISSPTNDIFYCYGNLKLFCEKNNINYPMLARVARKEITSYKGWTCIQITKEEYESLIKDDNCPIFDI